MEQIDKILNRGVVDVLPSKEALKKLMLERKITLYQGFDPTGNKLHIGHMVGLRKLRQFQDLGHTVIFLIGNGTGQAGDPSGKKKTREHFFNEDELRANAEDYVKQSSKIVRFDGENPAQIKYNGDWLNKITLPQMLDIAQHFSVQQLLERDMYQERIKAHETINLREFLYPLLQGYDSVEMNVDLEIGGTEQTFNMLAGRTLVKAIQGREKYVLSVPLLSDSNGVKIGKSEGNVIGLTDEPADFYGKIMALSDDSIIPCLTLLTDTPETEIQNIKDSIAKGENPMQFKKQLAFDLTCMLNSKSDAQYAQEMFEKTFQKGNIPENIQTFEVGSDPTTLLSLITTISPELSNSEARRLVTQGGVEVDNQVQSEPKAIINIPQSGVTIKIGKKTFAKILIK